MKKGRNLRFFATDQYLTKICDVVTLFDHTGSQNAIRHCEGMRAPEIQYAIY